MSSIRQKIFDGLIAKLKTIAKLDVVSYGEPATEHIYLTNLGEQVFPWRLEPLTADEAPGLRVIDPSCTPNQEGGALNTVEHRLAIEIAAEFYGKFAEARQFAMDAEQDLRACLQSYDEEIDATYGATLTVDKVEQGIEQHDTVLAGLKVSVSVTYTTDIGAS